MQLSLVRKCTEYGKRMRKESERDGTSRTTPLASNAAAQQNCLGSLLHGLLGLQMWVWYLLGIPCGKIPSDLQINTPSAFTEYEMTLLYSFP
ncbi:hypothetical protein V6N13_064217 [Hibiscus sabdariffa]